MHEATSLGCENAAEAVPNYPLPYSLQPPSRESVSYTDAPTQYWAQYNLTNFLLYARQGQPRPHAAGRPPVILGEPSSDVWRGWPAGAEVLCGV